MSKSDKPFRSEVAAARVESMIRMHMGGVPQVEIAKVYGVSDRRVRQLFTRARRNGLMESIIDRCREEGIKKALPKAIETYGRLLNTPAEDLHKHAKGYQVQLGAARDLARGLGVFETKSAVKTQSLSITGGMEEYLRARQVQQARAEGFDLEAEFQRPPEPPASQSPPLLEPAIDADILADDEADLRDYAAFALDD